MGDLLKVVEILLIIAVGFISATIAGDFIREWKKYKKDFE